MSKELDRLEHLRLGIQYIDQDKSPAFISHYEEDIDIIELALKDYEDLKIANSEQFKEKWVQDNLAMTFELTVAKPKLKALNVIREKQVDCNTLMFYLKKHSETGHIDYAFDSYNNYAKDSDKPQLTQEDFDLLKEILWK